MKNFDRVLFLPYHNGPDQGYKNYAAEAVHLPEHPEYETFLEIMKAAEKYSLFYTNYNFISNSIKMKFDVNNKKAFGFFMMALEKEKSGEYSDALFLVNKSLQLNNTENAFKLKQYLLNKTRGDA